MKQLLLSVCFAILCSSFLGAATFNRTDFRDESIYFLMTTRFYDGDANNNVQCWEAQSYNQGDPAWRGDFKGIIDRLDYIKALGFSAIWITPVVENCSGYDYHGYHALNFNKVDPRYESQDVSFQTLIDAVHAHDMKIILDVVFNHTGNFGESNLLPLFTKQGDLSSADCLIPTSSNLPSNYDQMNPGQQYQARLAQMKNTDGLNHDTRNIYHHYGNFNWDDLTSQWAQIAGDCVDLNTENPIVYNYILNCYKKFILMGVDGFRIDTGKHISRLVFNTIFNPEFLAAATAAGNPNFFMFSEICTRDRNYWYRNTPALSANFYTWKESQSYAWSSDTMVWRNTPILNGTEGFTLTNQASCIANYNDNSDTSGQPHSQNAFLNGNSYHTPDYSMSSGLNVIDFPMHWNFRYANDAFNVAKSGDWSYNDATFNVVYVDSHDYAPDGAPEGQRYSNSQANWAENMSLIFTFRGIPCIYYGSEIEFKKGQPIDVGPNAPLRNTGRAYYGGYITGDITVNDFADFSNATGNIAVSLRHPLALHLQRLNKLRQSIPALRKGQYSTSGCSGSLSFKRRFTNATTDSYVLVTISGSSTFTNIPNGTYTDAITGTTKIISNNRLTASCSGQGNMRIYVLSTTLTPAPGKIGNDTQYLYNTSPVITNQGNYPDPTEELIGGGDTNPETPTTPCINDNERSVFFHKSNDFGDQINVYIWSSLNGTHKVCGNWPGTAMTNLGNGNYKFVIPSAPLPTDNTWKIIFNDGMGNQTADLDFTMHGLYGGTNKGSIALQSTITLNCNDVPSNTNNPSKSEIQIYSQPNGLVISTPYATTLPVYTTTGILIRHLQLPRGITTLTDLPRGLYIIHHQKVVVY